MKSEGGKEWWIDSPSPSAGGERGLNEYTFKSEEDNQSFGGGDLASATD